jgi:hypothetical protein
MFAAAPQAAAQMPAAPFAPQAAGAVTGLPSFFGQ